MKSPTAGISILHLQYIHGMLTGNSSCAFTCTFLWIAFACVECLGDTYHVGPGFTYPSIHTPLSLVMPGDTIMVHEGIYTGGVFASNVQGTAEDWISIINAPGETVIFEGGTNAWQFTDAAYLYIRGFHFRYQTGNGLNFDDGGTFDTPAHHIVFEYCTFSDMNATGNNDLLKLSGIDSFTVSHCTFLNGSPGGSGIDMVGCHDGLITRCHFENLGSNSIQAKGGTHNIRIEGNFFKNGGARALNLGGSTGLQFFRPINAAYEAANLKVYSNIFIGSEAPVAFVGSTGCEVINNTIYLPGKWVIRILQETIDPERFAPCGYNTFRNNIIYIDNRVSVEVNTGPDTEPETFTFSNNLWYHSQNPFWTGPALPVADINNIVGQDPQFESPAEDDFHIHQESPATGSGYESGQPVEDYEGREFLEPRSIGAFEGGEPATNFQDDTMHERKLYLWPNPCGDELFLKIPDWLGKATFEMYNAQGKRVHSGLIYQPLSILRTDFPAGYYMLKVFTGSQTVTTCFIRM